MKPDFTTLTAKLPEPPFVMGVGGLDCAGKTTFATDLGQYLSEKGYTVSTLHIDDYNNLDIQGTVYDAYIKGGFTEDLAETYYHNSIHYGQAADAIRRQKLKTDVTIIEGVFLYKESLKHLIDIKIFLPVEPSIAKARYEKRKMDNGDPRPLSVFDDIWLPAFKRYEREESPQQGCHVIELSSFC